MVLSRTLTRNQPCPKNKLHHLFIGRRRNPQNSSRSGPESPLTRLSVDRPKCAVDYQVDHSKSCKTAGLNENVGRPTNWFLPSLSTSTDPSLVNVGRPPSRLMSCHRVKKLYLLFLPSLYTCDRSEHSHPFNLLPCSQLDTHGRQSVYL